MRKPSPTALALIVFWMLYAIAAAWTVYQSTPPVGRDLLFILGSYGVVLVGATGAMMLRAKLFRLRRPPES
jgi:hypothetical protein